MNGTDRFLNFLDAVYSENVADPILKKCVLVLKLMPTAAKKKKNTEHPANAFHERAACDATLFLFFFF